jgi:hypothetical protein
VPGGDAGGVAPDPVASNEEDGVGMLLSGAEHAEELVELPMPAEAFGLIALGTLFTLLAITWSFRSVGNKVGGKH